MYEYAISSNNYGEKKSYYFFYSSTLSILIRQQNRKPETDTWVSEDISKSLGSANLYWWKHATSTTNLCW